MQQLIIKTAVLIALAVCTAFDVKCRRIPLSLLGLLAAGGVIYVVITKGYTDPSRYMGIGAGLIFCVLSVLTKQGIGMGDALVFVILGWCLGIWQMLLLLCLAFGMAAAVSVVLLLCRKGNLRTSLPFLPFLYLAYGGLCLM